MFYKYTNIFSPCPQWYRYEKHRVNTYMCVEVVPEDCNCIWDFLVIKSNFITKIMHNYLHIQKKWSK